MLLVSLGLLLGAAALLWCFVLALTLGDSDTGEGKGCDARLFTASMKKPAHQAPRSSPNEDGPRFPANE